MLNNGISYAPQYKKEAEFLGKIYNPTTAGQATGQTQQGLFGGISDFLGGSNFGNLSAGVGAIGSIIQGIGGWDSARKQLKEQKKMNNLLHSQWQEELRRYNKYESQRDAASAAINDSAQHYTAPTRQSDESA